MKIYIAGIMQGSTKDQGIQEQDYRQVLRDVLHIHHPEADIYDPFLQYPDSVTYDDQRAREVLFKLAAEAGSSDVVIAYLPKASMGTALEILRAHDNGKVILCISPMERNWFINAFASKTFPSLEAFCSWLGKAQLSELVNSPKPD